MLKSLYKFTVVVDLFAYAYSFYILFPLLGGQSIDSGMQPLAIFIIVAPILISTSALYWIIGFKHKIKTLTKILPIITATLLCALIYLDQSIGFAVRLLGSFVCILSFSISIIVNRLN